ncbi:XRE family transcriptional regulator [Lactiplantibacillus plantarum]|nr:hypothetical protein BGV74_04500 [Lactiplantibacillus plantarum]MCG0569370.1 XRE family transcriptional regulator [Lactiplantibacillus plantarum]MCG0615682.1 XRE family transcriptional regulator [Lactiplantibacillus plantarum]MCG0629532.1 XRE family transcriptional regulator [Lactiplantibacillus plantarum]MCG0711860.1 XRE family transcriptional regulator [Lactiplantibacillus plantarum]
MLRKNKGMSQLELAKNITTRRSIGEVEHGYKDLPYTTMIKIIQRLGISLSNFEEYRQGHQFSADQALINEFESISDTSEVKKMKSILKKARQLEEKSTLRYIHYIICVLDALIHVDTYNCDQLTNLVKPVWNELSTVSVWNHTDLFIINNLLYIFDFQTALRIGKKIITKLNQYGDNNVLLQNAIYSNLAFINMTNSNAFGKSITINYLQKSIELTKHAHRYDLLLLSKIRLAMVLQQYEEAKKMCSILTRMGANNIVNLVYQDFPILVT